MVKFAVLRGPDQVAGGFSGGQRAVLETRHDEGSVLMQFRGAVSAVVWDARWQVFEAVLGHSEAVRAPPLHEKCTRQYAPCLKASGPPRGRKSCLKVFRSFRV